MAKQKVVVKLSLCCAKERTKALKTAVAMNGVQSVALDGDKLVVTGDGTDAICLTTQLRKKLGYADLISVTTGDQEKKEKEKEKEKKMPEESKSTVQSPSYQCPYQYQYSYPYQYAYHQTAYDYPKWYTIF